MKKPEWVVYGAYDGQKLLYIGKTGDVTGRRNAHRNSASWACDCTFSVMHRARSEAQALRIEARLIKKHRPPFNIARKPGGKVDGLLSRAEAQRIWHSDPTVPDRVLLAGMPGWTRDRANRAFGYRGVWRKPSVRVVACINAKLYRMEFHPETIRRKQPD